MKSKQDHASVRQASRLFKNLENAFLLLPGECPCFLPSREQADELYVVRLRLQSVYQRDRVFSLVKVFAKAFLLGVLLCILEVSQIQT